MDVSYLSQLSNLVEVIFHPVMYTMLRMPQASPFLENFLVYSPSGKAEGRRQRAAMLM